MKYLKLFSLIFLTLFLFSCKKDKVDGSTLRSFQSSINDMASSLSTVQQIKFQEALYIIKKYGTNTDAYLDQMNETAQLLNGKKTAQIFSIADSIAAANNVEWSSTGTPSLGEMNIFDENKPTEIDPNDITAEALTINIQPLEIDSIKGATAFMIIPRLVDKSGQPIHFSNATLEATLEVSSGGVKILTSRNFMTNNAFKGFYLKVSNLPADKILNNQIDAKVGVKTKSKTYEMTKTGIAINPNALAPAEENEDEIISDSLQTDTPISNVVGNPSATVSKFISNINSNNLKEAYGMSNNPSWGSYETFSNPTSGFGAVKSIEVKSIKTSSQNSDQASVNASYNVTDNKGNTSELQATYTLKASADGWKITNYKINSAE